MKLREERPRDTEAVRRVQMRAFSGHGTRDHGTADHGTVVADLVDTLRGGIAAGGGLALVAELDGQIVGQVMFTRSLLDAPRRLIEVQVLSPLGVLPQRQGQGIGSALVRRGLEIAADRAVPLVFLEGDPGYYQRFGFVPGGTRGFRKPSLRIPDAAFQVATLGAYESWMTGTLVYSEPFWSHDCVGRRDPGA